MIKSLKLLSSHFLFLIVFCSLLIVHCSLLTAQSQYHISPANADCDDPIVLHDTVFGPTNAPEGYGKKMEISDGSNSLYYFEKEHNTVWYRFTAPSDCTLTFDIIPEDIKDDYDFILFKYSGKNFCKDVMAKKILPVRSNISRNDANINSITGLSKDAASDFVHSGPGAQFSKAIKVKKGEVFYLVLDNVYANGKGHTLKLHYTGCSGNTTTPELSSLPAAYKLNFTVVDKATGEPVKSTIDILEASPHINKGIGKEKSIYHLADKSDCSVEVNTQKTYSIQVSAKGYLNYESIVDKDNLQTFKKVELEKIKVGKNFAIQTIYFYGNLSVFLPSSTPALEQLLSFMKENPTVKIEIQGFVNFPTGYGTPSQSQEEFNWKLSRDRAEAVYDFLVASKISPSRMRYEGFGATRMIYPNATTEKEEQLNRRVEIMITSY